MPNIRNGCAIWFWPIISWYDDVGRQMSANILKFLKIFSPWYFALAEDLVRMASADSISWHYHHRQQKSDIVTIDKVSNWKKSLDEIPTVRIQVARSDKFMSFFSFEVADLAFHIVFYLSWSRWMTKPYRIDLKISLATCLRSSWATDGIWGSKT